MRRPARLAALLAAATALPPAAPAQEASPPAAETAAPEVRPDASLEAVRSAQAGATLSIAWEGPGREGDYIAVVAVGDTRRVASARVRNGSPLELRAPAEPGRYELRYVSADHTVLARRPLRIAAVRAEVEIDEDVDAGETVPVAWRGPDNEGDLLVLVRVLDQIPVSSVPTSRGSPVRVRMPAEPGAYELRYVMSAGTTVLARKPLEVLPVTAWLRADARALAGASLEVDWDGPDYDGDVVAIAPEGAERAMSRRSTSAGAPLEVAVPLEPGAYELRYVMSQDDTVLATRPLEVLAVTATLEAAGEARAGAPVAVSWEGPAHDGDYLAVARPDDPGYESFRFVRDGSPLILDMPASTGAYELRYVASSIGETVLARRPITLTPVEASLAGPEEIAAGANMAVTWEGPDYRRDYVAIARAGAPEGENETFVYTSEDSPAVLVAPDAPGAYELRYVLGRDDSVLARAPVRVTE